MLEKFRKKEYTLFIIVIFLAFFVVNFDVTGKFIKWLSRDFRPSHCQSQDCIDPRVFQYLPKFPQDFSKVIKIFNYPNPLLEDFSEKISDEYYYKQPEFYPYFDSRCSSYYLNLKPGYKVDYIGVAGLGIFPSETKITAERGKTVRVISFWHSSCGVSKYQGVGLQEKLSDEMIKVKIEPKYFLLGPSFPAFSDIWTDKVVVEISIPQDINPGNYLVTIIPSDVPPEIEKNWIDTYKNYAFSLNSLISSDQIKWEIDLEVR